jgi:hypothetical protein
MSKALLREGEILWRRPRPEECTCVEAP